MSLGDCVRIATLVALGLFASQGYLVPQNASNPAPSAINRMPQQVAEPAVPADALELAAAGAQPVQDVGQRAGLINLLMNAQRHRNVRTYAYDLKTRFTAFGSSGSDGSWQLHDTSPGGNLYRWTAQGPSYSVVNLYKDSVLYSNQPANSVPLRVAQARAAIFFVQARLGPRAALRTAAGALDGTALVCALISYAPMAAIATGGRRWEEAEYCVDSKASNLVTYSPVPGLYVLYDYSKPLQFHDKVIANKFTITQGGHAIIEAQTDSITDASENPSAFEPADLNTVGVGPIMTAPLRYRVRVPSPAAAANGAEQIVVVHGMQSPNGHLADLELITSTDAALNNGALEYAAKWQGGSPSEDIEGGATPQSHEVFLTLQYAASLH